MEDDAGPEGPFKSSSKGKSVARAFAKVLGTGEPDERGDAILSGACCPVQHCALLQPPRGWAASPVVIWPSHLSTTYTCKIGKTLIHVDNRSAVLHGPVVCKVFPVV